MIICNMLYILPVTSTESSIHIFDRTKLSYFFPFSINTALFQMSLFVVRSSTQSYLFCVTFAVMSKNIRATIVSISFFVLIPVPSHANTHALQWKCASFLFIFICSWSLLLLSHLTTNYYLQHIILYTKRKKNIKYSILIWYSKQCS